MLNLSTAAGVYNIKKDVPCPQSVVVGASGV